METQDRIERTVQIDAPRDRVWALVATPGWWIGEDGITANRVETRGDREVAINPTLGEFPLVIESSQEPDAIAYRWAPWDEQKRAEQGTLVEFTLTGAAEGPTTVRVVESGFASLDLAPDSRETQVRENTAGWRHEMGLLKRHVRRLRSLGTRAAAGLLRLQKLLDLLCTDPAD